MRDRPPTDVNSNNPELEPKSAQHPGALEKLAPRSVRFGLVAVFGLLGFMVCLLSIASWLNYTNLANEMADIADRSVGDVDAMAEVSRHAIAMTSIGPSLANVETRDELATRRDQLAQVEEKFLNALASVLERVGDMSQAKTIQVNAARMSANLQMVFASMYHAVANRVDRLRLERTINGLYHDVESWRDSLTDSSSTEHLLLSDNLEILFELYGEVGHSDNSTKIARLKARQLRLLEQIEQSAAALASQGGDPSNILIPVINRLKALSQASETIFEVRLQELKALAAARAMVVRNRELGDELQSAANAIMELNRERNDNHRQASRSQIFTRSMVLGGVAFVTMILIVVLGYGYVGIHLVRRFTALSEGVVQFSKGNLDVQVDVSGRDEIGEMARALGTLRRQYRTMADKSGKTEQQLQHLSILVEASTDGVALFARDDKLLYANQRFRMDFPAFEDPLMEKAGLVEVLARSAERGDLRLESERENWLAKVQAYWRSAARPIDLAFVDGKHLRIELQRQEDGSTQVVVVDTTQSVKREAELMAQKLTLSATFETMAQGMLVFDGLGRLQVWNRRLQNFFNFGEEQLPLGLHISKFMRNIMELQDIASERLDEAVATRLRQMEREDRYIESFKGANGLTLEMVRTPMREGGFVCTFTDVSERHAMEKKYQFMATHDELTGLANRTLLRDRLAQAIAQAKRSHGQGAVISFSIDNRDSIVDQFGHDVADSVMIALGERAKSMVRLSDTVSRLGGNEFAIVLSEIIVGMDLGNFCDRLLTCLSEPVSIADSMIEVEVYAGITRFPMDGKDADRLLVNASLATMRAKSQPRGKIWFFDSQMGEEVQRRAEFRQHLRTAMHDESLKVHFQPIVDLKNGEIVGAEALIRWLRDETNLVLPKSFLQIAESSGLIQPLAEWSLRQACAEILALDAMTNSELKLNVNLSTAQLQRGAAYPMVKSVLDDTGFDPGRLEFDISESVFLLNSENIIEDLRRMADLGVRLALDDFGTGYSALSHLRQLPIHTVKIDVSVTRQIDSGDEVQVAKAIINLAHDIGLKALAEGVERPGQIRVLRDLGCDLCQGYYFLRPASAEALGNLLENRRAFDFDDLVGR